MRIVIAGGGTAGHVNPAIALAAALDGHDVSFIGTKAGAEARLVPAAGRPLLTIDVGGFDRSRPLSLLPTGARATRAVFQARSLLARERADVVVGMGGYVSLPACFAAGTRGTPIVIHEQNIVLGLTNRLCRPLARAVAVSFEETLEQAGRHGVFVGNPVLREFAEADLDAARERGLARWSLDPERPTVLVFGGSQGAGRINGAAAGLARLWAERGDRQILHITGTRGFGSGGAAVPNGALVYRAVDFVQEMVDAYAVAHVALCRGGATTVAELGVTGLPSIIVPYPHHRDRQQERHGRALERAGAAVVVMDAEATAAAVARVLDEIIDTPGRRERMARAARSQGRPDAAARLARVVVEAAA